MKTTPLWMRLAKRVENPAQGPLHGGDRSGSQTELPVLQQPSMHFSIRGTDLSRRKHGIFWALLARGDGPVFTKGKRFEGCSPFGNVNCAENLLRGQPQYNIAGSN
jgi:hypothetical protein